MDSSIVHELLRQSLPSTIAVFLASAMFSLGLGMTVGQIVEPLRNRRLIAVSLFANFVLVPLFALGLASVIPMDRALQTGFLLYAFASGAESGPKFVQLAAGNAAFALGLLVPMTVITVFGLPMVISLVVPDVHVARGAVLLKLLVVVAVPVGIGLYLRARYRAFATRLGAAIHRLWTVLVFVVIAQLVYVNFDAILDLRLNALLAGALMFAFACACGYALGGPDRANRRALAIMTFARGSTLALMIGGQVFAHDPKVLVIITVMSIMSVVFLGVAVVGFRRSSSRAAESSLTP